MLKKGRTLIWYFPSHSPSLIFILPSSIRYAVLPFIKLNIIYLHPTSQNKIDILQAFFSENTSPLFILSMQFYHNFWLNQWSVQGTLKSLLQHHSSKASILLHSAFFTVQLSHPYMITGKTIALTRWTFVDKVMRSEEHTSELQSP